MDHQEAKNAKLLERYLLGEMASPERDAFEEHYFSCAVCAEELVTAAKFLDNARRPLLPLEAEGSPVTNKESQGLPWWERWLVLAPKPALAGLCAVLAIALVWRGRPESLQPEVTGSYFVTATRAAGGAPRRIELEPSQRRVALLFNQTDASATQLTFVLEDASGRTVLQFGGRAPKDTSDVQILIPVTGLHAGVYNLRVQNAVTHADVAALPFELTVR
ncbi:MAG: zf-HC2 domain-containing protein [Acidobacteria bacterium]|nr:zf-HC2 domain-containing protein [Acidobacteriota bacterium]